MGVSEKKTMASGIVVSDDTIAFFEKVKTSKEDCALMILTISDGQVVIAKKVTQGEVAADTSEERHANILKHYPDDAANFMIHEFQYTDKNDILQKKLCLVKWIPEGAPRNDKMTYASSVGSTKAALNGISKEIQANDHTDVEFKEF